MNSVFAWVRKHKKAIIAGLFAIVIIQLLYPSGYTRPLVFSEGKYLGLRSMQTMNGHYKYALSRDVSVVLGDERKSQKITDYGLGLDESKLKSSVQSPLWQRVIPLSLFVPINIDTDDWQSIDHGRQDEMIKTLAESYHQTAQSAGVAKNEEGVFVLNESKSGREIINNEFKKQLSEFSVENDETIRVPTRTIDPVITNEMVQQVIDKTKPENLQKITFAVEKKNYVIDEETISEWLTIVINEEEKRVSLEFDQQSASDWFDKTIGSVNTGIPSVVTIRDGAEESRTPGTPGRGVDKTRALNDIKQAVIDKQSQVKGEVVQLPVAIQTNRSYSATQSGFRIMFDEWAKEYPGMESSVYIKELSGRGLSAERGSGSAKYVASVAKLFIAHYLLANINDLNQQAYEGRSYSDCIEAMIRVSDNTCAEQIRSSLGVNTINGYVRNQGFGSVNVGEYVASASDIGSFLERLNNGSLLDPAKSARIMNPMSNQIYRSGIPAGSFGSPVADKPGFYGDVWTDAGIVQSPSSTYVLVILTKGGGSGAVKTLAQRVHQTLN